MSIADILCTAKFSFSETAHVGDSILGGKRPLRNVDGLLLLAKAVRLRDASLLSDDALLRRFVSLRHDGEFGLVLCHKLIFGCVIWVPCPPLWVGMATQSPGHGTQPEISVVTYH